MSRLSAKWNRAPFHNPTDRVRLCLSHGCFHCSSVIKRSIEKPSWVVARGTVWKHLGFVLRSDAEEQIVLQDVAHPVFLLLLEQRPRSQQIWRGAHRRISKLKLEAVDL